eukprot:TRINITY_DN70140_c0_g1_i1.p1 TRINITY_DN70140_c0_g1~~TRINITY_DN70140_c0_g1_i1.p1  ORF type:complete len:269 (-),score=40.96 TRINITY_DN70140_c0_g1_i1:215-1021(-)
MWQGGAGTPPMMSPPGSGMFPPPRPGGFVTPGIQPPIDPMMNSAMGVGMGSGTWTPPMNRPPMGCGPMMPPTGGNFGMTGRPMGPGMIQPPMGHGMMTPMRPCNPYFNMPPPPFPSTVPLPPPLDSEDRVEPPDPRVGRLQLCKDPKFNGGVRPEFAFEVQQRKLVDGRALEEILSREAYVIAAGELAQSGRKPPPEEVIKKPGVPFQRAVPAYEQDSGLWTRKVELRSMDEAMRGDVSQPMDRPILFKEDFPTFKAGQYVKDDCMIA